MQLVTEATWNDHFSVLNAGHANVALRDTNVNVFLLVNSMGSLANVDLMTMCILLLVWRGVFLTDAE